MMKLADLLSPWCNTPYPDCTVSGLQNDSRHIKPGDLFFAYPGAAVDGRIFCQQAIHAGAVAIVYEPENLPGGFVFYPHVTYAPIPQLARQLAAIASRFYENPTRALSVIGVTGTNGKTTIAYQLAQAHGLLGDKAAYIGTLGHGFVDALEPAGNTTPDALCLQHLLYQYVHAGVQYVCMEVSSHALHQQRVAHIDFTQAIYTNLTHDHLDYHKTIDAYAHAKAALFATPTLQCAVINHDDAYGQLMADALPATCKKLTYGLHEFADVRALNLDISMLGSSFEVASPWGLHAVNVKSIGAFNVYNSLAVFSSLMAKGYAINDVLRVMTDLRASPGRMALVAQEPCVIIDYAHTPDALENVLSTLTQLKKARLWVVFGCGGDRDKTKRPMMGRIASHYADHVVITSDNPRSEDPALIVEDIAAGVLPDAQVCTIIDREQAIHHALKSAGRQDIVLIAGKGHECYQQIGHERFVFSDEAVVRRFLN